MTRPTERSSGTMTLWILFCRMTAKVDILFTFYAQDREHAEGKTEEILKKYSYERLDLKAYPRGFRMAFSDLPGTIEEDDV